jgi:hypothetical protein
MKRNRRELCFIGLVGLIVFLGAASGVSAQSSPFFSQPSGSSPPTAHPNPAQTCNGATTGAAVRLISDVGFEGLKTTACVFNAAGCTGGDGAKFDPTPVLSTTVNLTTTGCLNAHLSAIVGSSLTYGTARLALFQVTLTRLGTTPPGAPQHMFGHYETPYGIYGPAVAIEAERDVDTFGSNFFQRIGTSSTDLPPGVYRVDVWWAGAPPGSVGGALGAAFVLKLYMG